MLMSRDTGPLYKISFGSGGDSRLVELAQSNALTDIDTLLAIDLLTDTRIAQGERIRADGDDERSARRDARLGERSAGAGALSFPAFLVGEAETAFAAQNAGDTDETAAPAPRDGVFRDGARIEADDAPESPLTTLSLSGALDPDAETGAEIQLMARPAPDAFGTAAASGSNVLVNEAALIDALIPARTLAVMGDVFQRDAIMQINVHSNTDIVAMNGAIQSAMKDPGHDDTITNLAIVSHNPVTLPAATGLNPNGLTVNVDIADQDIFDVKTLFQQNLADDGDRISWGGTDAWSMMGFGGNLQGNAARLVDLGKSYDLVVVTGSYYALNFIGQINILADDDITALFGPPGGTALEYHSEPNTVSNEARIDKRGEQDWTGVDPDAADLFAETRRRRGSRHGGFCRDLRRRDRAARYPRGDGRLVRRLGALAGQHAVGSGISSQ